MDLGKLCWSGLHNSFEQSWVVLQVTTEICRSFKMGSFSRVLCLYHLSLTPRLWHPIKCPNVISFFNSSKCRVNFVSRQRWELRRKRYFCILRHFAAAVQRTAPPAYFFFSFWGTKTKKNWKWRRGSSSSSNLQKKKNTGFCPEHKVKAIMKTLLCISVSAQLSRKERR